jgi:hypothetical protein
MTPNDSHDNRDESDDSEVAIDTGRRGQRLIFEGWFASHADSGTPGPHVHLRTSDQETAVVRTDQVPKVIEALTKAAKHVEQLWNTHGDEYAAEVVLRWPDPQDPAVIEEQRQKRLKFIQAVRDNVTEVMRMLTDASSTDEALDSIAALLGVDAADVMMELARFDLLALTRPATSGRLTIIENSQN